MVEIIEHNDYNKPADNETVFEVPIANNQKKKYFKMCEGIFVDPTIIELKAPPHTSDTSDKLQIIPFISPSSIEKERQDNSKRLSDITILLKRINSTKSGDKLLNNLSAGLPAEWTSISDQNVWNISNMLMLPTGNITYDRRRRITCLIKATTGYIRNYVAVRSSIKDNIINRQKVTLYFNTECIFSIKKGGKIHYFDPAIALYHELVHVFHSTYGAIIRDIKEEEYLTFGKDDARVVLEQNTPSYIEKRKILTENLSNIREKIKLLENPEDQIYFNKKYGFTNLSPSEPLSKKFIDEYLDNIELKFSEYEFVKELNLKTTHRTSYEDKLFLPFKLDITDPKVYTVEKGFVKPTVTMEELKASAPHLFVNVQTMKDRYTLNSCFRGEARSKRDIDFKIIPLEPLGEDIDIKIEVAEKYNEEPANKKKSSHDRNKREAECQDEIIDIIEDLDTVYNKSKEIPRKLLGKHAKEQIINVPEDMVVAAPPKDTDVKESIVELETFKVGELVGFDRITPKHVLNAHRINHDLTEGTELIYFTSDDFSTSTIAGNITFTHNKNLSTKMNLMNKGKAVLKTGNAIVNIAQFGMWVDEIVEDFKGDTGKDNLHIANDVLSIVPYLGQVMNIGVDIKDGNYLGAVETLGILVLLEVFPELMLPVFLIGIIVNAIQKNKQQKEMVSKAVWNVLMEREQLLDSQLETEAEHLAHICIERIQKIADHVEQQLTFNAEAIINNVKYYGKRLLKNNNDVKSLEEIVVSTSTKLAEMIQQKRNKVIETLFNGLKKTIVKDFKEKAQGEINQFNEQTRAMIKDMLKEHSKDISSGALDEGLKIVEHYMKTQNIGATIKHELDLLASMIGQGVNIVVHKTGRPIVYSHIGLNKDNKAVDKISNKVLEKQNVGFGWGRNGNALKFEAGNFLEIDDLLFKNLTLANDFTIEFWIKVPLTKNYDQETNEDIAIIENLSNDKSGWSIILNGRYIKFVLCSNKKQSVILYTGILSYNTWQKITIVNNKNTKKLLFYNYNQLIHSIESISLSHLSQSDLNIDLSNNLKIGINKKSLYKHIMLDDFKVYLFPLKEENINTYFKADYNPELLYDYSGSCLRNMRSYVLAIYNPKKRIFSPVTHMGNTRDCIYNEDTPLSSTDWQYAVTIMFDNRSNYTAKSKNRAQDFIYNNDVISLQITQTSLYFGVDISTPGQDINISINSKVEKLKANPCRYFEINEIDITKHITIFKIFNMFNYSKLPDIFNTNVVSFAFYTNNSLTTLLLANNQKILGVKGILMEDKTGLNKEIVLPKNQMSSASTIIDTYKYNTLFYLFPLDEIQYYFNLLNISQ